MTFLFSFKSYAYHYAINERGEKVRWAHTSSQITLYIDGTNSTPLPKHTVESAALESVQSWNGISPVKINPIIGSAGSHSGSTASLKFSQNPAYFGQGVLAITALRYNNNSGVIVGAEVLINENPLVTIFTSEKYDSSGSKAYIGDIISHEIGHLLGLNHSEVEGSSMIFSIFKGQHKLHSDDHIGIKSLYDKNQGTKIQGRVVTRGKDPLYGVHVQLINLHDNQVQAGVFTDDRGVFEFAGVPADESYAIYLSPIKSKDHLSQSFLSARKEVCTGKSFVPSFFTKCGGRGRGKAQVFTIAENQTLDLGDLGVKCVNSLDPSYMSLKLSSNQSFALEDAHKAYNYLDEFKTFTAFVGQFQQSDVETTPSPSDILEFDLSALDVSDYSNPHVRFSLSTAKLASAYGLKVTITQNDDEIGSTTHADIVDPVTGKRVLDFDVSKSLSLNQSENIFRLKISPLKLEGFEKTEIFAAPSLMTFKEMLYFVVMEVHDIDEESNILRNGSFSDHFYEDNSSCLEGKQLQVAQAYSTLTEKSDVSEDQGAQVMSCGTIGEGGGGPNGPVSFFLGLFATLGVLRLLGKKDEFFV